MIEEKRREKLSRLLTYILRHNPSSVGMELDDEGFSGVDIEELARRISRRRGYEWVRPEHIKMVVERDPKGRFEMRDWRIRATYGHTVRVDKVGTPVRDIKVLFHGTTLRAWRNIDREGIKPQRRRYVHLSSSIEEAIEVASRHGPDVVVLEVDVEAMANDGYEVRKAGRSIYLVKEVPRRYITGIYIRPSVVQGHGEKLRRERGS